ncbi:MAG: gliding motility-associated C-terminal domain-containing protein, partial [Bacteroidota bacterium]
NPLATTSYIINVTDPFTGCTGRDTVIVQVDNSRVNAGADIDTCPGSLIRLNATLIPTIIPGPPVYTWTTLSGTSVGIGQSVNVNPTVTTTYVVAMSGGGCIKRDTITVTTRGLNASSVRTEITCSNANDGKIQAFSDGNAPFTYVWSVNANTGNADTAVNLQPGSYSVTVTDATGCSGSATAQITQPPPLTFTYVIDTVNCFGGNDGSITVNPSGGTGANTYQWSNGLSSTPTVSSLLAGNYTVTVRDSNLCTATGSIIVSQPTQIVFGSATIQDVRCFGGNTGRITTTASGGTGNYTYSWSHNAGLNATTAGNLIAGAYTVTIRDANNCTASATYTVAQPSGGLTVGAPTYTRPTCFGGSNGTATVTPSGGVTPYRYVWTPSGQTTQTATGLSAQTYTVVVTDDSSCTASAFVNVLQPQQILIDDSITNVRCNGNSNGIINLTLTYGSQPLSYAWSTGPITQDLVNIPAGNYSVLVTDNTSCTQSAFFTVTEPPVLALTAPAITKVLCFGDNTGSITANTNNGGVGPYTFTWNPTGTTQTISSLVAGTYVVTLSDANSCSASASYQISEPAAALNFGTPATTNVLCNGLATGSITVTVTGGTGSYTYSWSPALVNSATVSSLSAGNYSVTVRDANGCSITSSHIITQPSAITFGTPSVTNASCYGYNDGSAQVFPSGGAGSYSYTWNGAAGSNPQSGLTAGNYTVVVADGNSCSVSTTVTITEPGQFSVALTPYDATCFGASNGYIDAVPSGGTAPFTFVWSNASTDQNAFQISTGTYTLTVTDNNGCSVSGSANVGEPDELIFSVVPTQVKCPGDKNGTIAVNASGGTGPYNYSATQDGVNVVYATDGVIVGLASGYYAVLLADNNGCTLVDTTFVPSPVADTFDYTVDSTSCFGSQHSDGAVYVIGLIPQNTPYQFGADGGPLSQSGSLYNLTAGSHVVNAVNNWGCVSNFMVYVPEPVEGKVTVYPLDSTVQLGESVQLYSSFAPYPASVVSSYIWSPATGLSCVDCSNPLVTAYNRRNEYVLTVNYNGTCVSTATLTVSVQDTLEVFVPNSFSPNGDGNNDEWLVYGEGIKSVDLKIFNRWGEKVFETDNQFEGWDGTSKGEL